MRTLRSLATIGCVFAILGAATSPSIAGPKDGPKSGEGPIPLGWGPMSKEAKEYYKNLDRQIEFNRILSNPARGNGAIRELGSPPKTVNSKFGRFDSNLPTAGVAVGLQKKDAPPRQPPRTTDSWITPKTTAAPTTNQTLYKPVTSLGVKPSVPGTPQQKR
jgi:hypothetical protein